MSKNKRSYLLWAWVIFISFSFALSGLSAETGEGLYFKARKIYTSDNMGVLQGGGMLVEGNKIVRLDKKPKPPKSAQIIDFADKIIIPGLIDAHCSWGFREEDFTVKTEPPPALGLPILQRFFARPLSPPPAPEARSLAVQAVFYRDPTFQKFLAEGITTAKISIPTEYLVGGSSALVRLGACSPADFVLKSPAAVEFSLAAGEKTMERYGELKKIFLDALEYEKSFKKYQKDLKAYLEKKKGKDKEEKGKEQIEEKTEGETQEPKEPKKDENQEIILQVLKRKIPAMVRAVRINEVQAAVELAKEFGINLVLVGGQEGYKMAEELATKRIPVIAGPEPVYIKKGEKINFVKKLLNQGVLVAFGSQSAMGARFLPFQLSYAIQNGLTEMEALGLVTINAARALGLADRTGSLGAGKEADFAVLSGEPFRLETRVEKVYMNGRLAYSEEKL
jgi:imidazolonepropionase-like amidohydrolase